MSYASSSSELTVTLHLSSPVFVPSKSLLIVDLSLADLTVSTSLSTEPSLSFHSISSSRISSLSFSLDPHASIPSDAVRSLSHPDLRSNSELLDNGGTRRVSARPFLPLGVRHSPLSGLPRACSLDSRFHLRLRLPVPCSVFLGGWAAHSNLSVSESVRVGTFLWSLCGFSSTPTSSSSSFPSSRSPSLPMPSPSFGFSLSLTETSWLS